MLIDNFYYEKYWNTTAIFSVNYANNFEVSNLSLHEYYTDVSMSYIQCIGVYLNTTWRIKQISEKKSENWIQ